MLMLVTDRDESLRAFEAFEFAFTASAALFPNHYFGFQGGHEKSMSTGTSWPELGAFLGSRGIKRESCLAVFGTALELTTRASTRRLTSRSK